MKFLSAIVLLSFFITKPSFTQVFIKKGYVITNSRSVISGWIDFYNWNNPPRAITLREDSASSKVTVYSISQIIYFEILDFEAYFRVPVQMPAIPHVDTSLDRHGYLKNIASQISPIDSVFFKLLVEGDKYTLYSSSELGDGNMHYYLRCANSQELQELKYCYCDSRRHRKSPGHNSFRELLRKIISKENATAAQMAAIDSATPDNLKEVFIVLNQGQAEALKFERYSNKLNWLIMAGSGLSITQEPYYTGTNYAGKEYSTREGIGNISFISIGMDYGAPLLFNSTTLRAQLTLEKHSNKALNFYSINPSFSYVYERLYRNFRWANGAGAGVNISFIPKRFTEEFWRAYVQTERCSVNFNLTSRLIYKKLELGVVVGVWTSSFIYSSIKPYSYSFYLGYHFNKYK